MNTEVMFSSEATHWSTPKELFDEWNSKFNFTLDCCADTTNYKVSKYYNEKQNGLMQSWANEVVWCNPPYKTASDWVAKAYKEMVERQVTTVMLLPARTDTRWFHEYIYNKTGVTIYFIKGRLKFSNSKNSAPFPSMIVIFSSIVDMWTNLTRKLDYINLICDKKVEEFKKAVEKRTDFDKQIKHESECFYFKDEITNKDHGYKITIEEIEIDKNKINGK